MIDHHSHLWPHGSRPSGPSLSDLERHCEAARGRGVTQVVVSEHLFRFTEASDALGPFWEDSPALPPRLEPAGRGLEEALRSDMASYWQAHQGASLERYVQAVTEAKEAGLPVLLGIEVDHYGARSETVRRLVGGYPFDVVLGSVHWLGLWRFDDLDSELSMSLWDAFETEAVWEAYAEAFEEMAASGIGGLAAHPDLVKVAGRLPEDPAPFWRRIVAAAARYGLALEVSSAGWRKPVGEQYPALGLLRLAKDAGIRFATSSDGHGAGGVGEGIDALAPLLLAEGIEGPWALVTPEVR